jgi:hypothetical protein
MKVIKLLCVMLLIMSLSACVATETKYVKEFPFLPALNGMTIVGEVKVNEIGILEASYSIKGFNYEDVLGGYEKILIEDGWKVTDDQKPGFINVSKDDHQAVLAPEMESDQLLLVIMAK